MSHASEPRTLHGAHCAMTFEKAAPPLVVLTIRGTDAGELADVPFRELERRLDASRPVRLFIDARATKAVSVDVSNAWCRWLTRHRDHFQRITMLTGSRYVALTAQFVRRFGGLEEVMSVTADPDDFDRELNEGRAAGPAIQ